MPQKPELRQKMMNENFIIFDRKIFPRIFGPIREGG